MEKGGGTIADSFAAVDPAITFEDALVRARRVEARKNLLMPVNSIKSAPKVASSAIPTSSLYSLLGIPPTATLQPSSKPPDENAKALTEMKDALQTLRQGLRDWKTASSNAAQTNRNFQPRGRGFGFHGRGFQNRGFRGNRSFNSHIACQNCRINGHHSSVCWRPAINNYPYYNQQTFSPPQMLQSLPPLPVRPALPAPIVRPVTAIQSVSAEVPDPSLQVQA